MSDHEQYFANTKVVEKLAEDVSREMIAGLETKMAEGSLDSGTFETLCIVVRAGLTNVKTIGDVERVVVLHYQVLGDECKSRAASLIERAKEASGSWTAPI